MMIFLKLPSVQQADTGAEHAAHLVVDFAAADSDWILDARIGRRRHMGDIVDRAKERDVVV